MTWYAFIDDGHVYNLNGVAQTQLQVVDPGVHGYTTETLALENPNIAPNPAAVAYLAELQYEARLPVGGGSLGVLGVYQVTMPKGTGTGGVGQSPTQAQQDQTGQQQVKGPVTVSNPLDFLSNVADFFDRLTQANTWIRIAEFMLGGALILVGVAHMAKGTQAGQAAAKAVKTAGLAAAL